MTDYIALERWLVTEGGLGHVQKATFSAAECASVAVNAKIAGSRIG
jgi:hypothetical protein